MCKFCLREKYPDVYHTGKNWPRMHCNCSGRMGGSSSTSIYFDTNFTSENFLQDKVYIYGQFFMKIDVKLKICCNVFGVVELHKSDRQLQPTHGTISAHFWLLYHICSVKVPLLKLRAAFTPLGETVLEGREGNSGFSAQYLNPKCW